MTIRLPEALQTDIMAAVNRGRYATLNDAMTDAAALLVQRLKQEEAEQLEITRKSVAEMKAGQGQPVAEVLADMQRMIAKKQGQ
jgi:Arc/MetJ-type ribon-helix-helix transcriptional regulator